ncbi:glutaredoxin [Alphaproteobacteria bacterium]|nr:glutaredoxin [Alphaproteobacteria bacterium]
MSANPVFKRIEQDIAQNPVLLYMVGTPMFPMSNASAQAVLILSEIGVAFKGTDVIPDPSLKEGLREYANWPALPQLYVQGKFVGGADTLCDMAAKEELIPFFQTRGLL